MARGPAPTPTNILALKGSWRVKQRIDSGEPMGAPLDRDDPPEDLPPLLVKHWESLVPAARSLGVMTLADIPAMILLCEHMAVREMAMDDILKNGMQCISESGARYQSPAVGIRNQATIQIKALMEQFGLTPSAKTRVKAIAPKEKTEALPRRRVVS